MVANMNKLRGFGRRAAAAGLGLVLAGASLAAAVPAFADSAANNTGNTGTTEVTVMTADSLDDIPDPDNYDIDEGDLLSFEVPTVIPFVALANGTLVGPSADATRITNYSEFGIHVVEASVVFEDDWVGVADAEMVLYENAIDFQFGPSDDSMTDAATTTDDDVSYYTDYNMTYAGSDTDSIGISTQGNVNNVSNNLVAGEQNKVATITWTISAGNAVASTEDDE